MTVTEQRELARARPHAAHVGGCAFRSTLVIGYGNPLRSDDGAGQEVARLVARRLRSVGVIAAHQLTPELAADMVGRKLVVFVDACAQGPAGSLAMSLLSGQDGAMPPPGAKAGAAAGEAFTGSFWHHSTPESVLWLARELYGASPAAVLVTIGVETVQPGTGLSLPVRQALPCAVDAVRALARRQATGGSAVRRA